MPSNYNFSVQWDLEQQTVYYSSPIKIDFPINIVVKEYKSNATIWHHSLDYLEANESRWICPASKKYMNYKDMEGFTGIKFCVYNKHTDEQLYEQPFFRKFYNIHTSNLSNTNPYYHNYIEYFLHKRYNRWLNKKYKLVVDVGANVGVFTECMLELYNCEQVVAIECNENLIKDLKKSYKNRTNVVILDKALHYNNDTIEFHQCDTNPGISTTSSPDEVFNSTGIPFAKTIKVSTVTIKDIIDLYGKIDLLKIDIEGGEYDILLNTDDSMFDNINNLFIECHTFNQNVKFIQNYYSLIRKLEQVGYVVEELYNNQIYNNSTSECIFAHKSIKGYV